jgi:hypothetical protein
MAFFRRHMMQGIADDCDIEVRRRKINSVLFNLHAVGNLGNFHGRIFFQQGAHDAFMGRIKMLDDHESNVASGRYMRKEQLKRFETACRGTDSDYGEFRFIRWNNSPDCFSA